MSEQDVDIAKFHIGRAGRPLLARVADSVYWMSRYVERAEHVARVLLVNSNLLMDVGDLNPQLRDRLWLGVVKILSLEMPESASKEDLGTRVARYMTLDSTNPNSLVSCITRARENARSIRENISAEMWENLNTLYWSMKTEEAATRFEETPTEVFRGVMSGCLLFQGLADQTMAHGQAWLFMQVAKYLERIDITTRILESKHEILNVAEVHLEAPLRNIHWMAVLRSCCSIETYRRMYVGDLEPLRVATFILFEATFPRSIRYSVSHAHNAMEKIRRILNPNELDPAERILGRLEARLEFAEVREVTQNGLAVYLQRIREQSTEASMTLQKTYFLS